MKRIFVLISATVLVLGCGDKSSDSAPVFNDKVALGEALYSDKNLSFNRTQSCATCHSLSHGFIDNRTNQVSANGKVSAVSLGDNGTGLGDRNAPTVGYAAFSSPFKKGERSRVASQKTSGVGSYKGYLGGQFWDGRAATMADQAKGPPTNPIEMGMPDKAAVVERLKENRGYVAAFEKLYGVDIFDNVEKAYNAMADSIGEFEIKQRAVFYPFDSKYDKSLLFPEKYIYQPGTPAALGKTLFFSSDFTCAACHQLRPLGNQGEIFTSFEYHNIGIPENTALRAITGVTTKDKGLAQNSNIPEAERAAEEGKFKVPTLRNVAVTAPYMHNGIFNELETVMLFYEHAKKRGLKQQDSSLNPETQLPWGAPEIDKNIEHELLRGNDVEITAERAKAFACFMMTLTDAKFEHLLDAQKVKECGI